MDNGSGALPVEWESMQKAAKQRGGKQGGSALRLGRIRRPVGVREICYSWFFCDLVVAMGLLGTFLTQPGAAQDRRPLEPPIASQRELPQHRTRLILKDGNYQMVLSYAVKGDVVRYRSAERNGEPEDIPLALVDLPATKAWERAHDPATSPTEAAAQGSAPVLSPELAREEATRAARTPEVVRDLRLPDDDSMLVLDTFQGMPELVPLPQQGSDLNRETAHAVQKGDVNPASSPHDLLFLKEERADVQVHVPDPEFYVRLEGKGEADSGGGGSFTVDTGGQAGRATSEGGSPQSEYVIEHLDVRRGQRAVESFQPGQLGSGRLGADVIEMQAESLPGGVWLRLKPKRPLAFGEYALIEVLGRRTVNLDTWDFGVHPTAKENDEAIRPEPKKPVRLERR